MLAAPGIDDATREKHEEQLESLTLQRKRQTRRTTQKNRQRRLYG